MSGAGSTGDVVAGRRLAASAPSADREDRRDLAGDPRSGPAARPTRRRGAELEAAIFEAVVAELDEVGYARLTIEGVAARSGAGKASIYRRWPTRAELVLRALHATVPQRVAPSDTGSLRGDLLALLGEMAALMNGPLGQAFRGIIGESVGEPAGDGTAPRSSTEAGGSHGVDVHEPLIAPLSSGRTRTLMRVVADRAADRGDLTGARLTDLQLEVGPALLRSRVLGHGSVSSADVRAIVDEAVLPLWLGPRPAS